MTSPATIGVEHTFPPSVAVPMGKSGCSISDTQPLVCHLDRTVELLTLDLEALEAAVVAAQLQPWGENAQGVPVYRWPELLEAADAAGLPVPQGRGTVGGNARR
jgi:hypothetical protein